MDRKEFIKTCGFACLGVSTLGMLLQSCAGSKIISAQILGDNIIVPLADFKVIKNNTTSFRKYLVIQNEKLQYPICVYRFSDQEYSALYMQCTHQGAELTAYGDKMVCSAHGSEFDNKGNVTNAPADKPLKKFPTDIDNQNLKISLKASL
jgi:Rieske Fe-S protein